MIATATEVQQDPTLADILERLGSIPLERIAAYPPPGTATEDDLFVETDGQKRLYELVDGVLVEKPMGYFESRLAAVLIYFIESFLEHYDLGIVLGADATVRVTFRSVRLPDVCFVSWDHFPGRKLPRKPVLNVIPDLAVEIISAGNTTKEMELKLQEYFSAGARLVWYAYPDTQRVKVYTSPTEVTVLTSEDALDGGTVLPGFQLPIKTWYDRAGEREEE